MPVLATEPLRSAGGRGRAQGKAQGKTEGKTHGPARGPVGVIVNPRSQRNRRGVGTPYDVDGADLHIAVPSSLAELTDTLSHFARREVATVVIDGGDGTVREVLTAMAGVFAASQPALAIMPSGNTNLIVGDTGGIASGGVGLAHLLQALAGERPLRQTWRPALDVTWPDAPGRLVRGMLFGAAAFAQGVAFANQSLGPRGIHHRSAVALSVAGMLRRALFGQFRRHLLAGEEMGVRVDGGQEMGGRHFLVMVTPLDRLVFGLWPFADIGDGPLHWLDVTAPPRHLLRVTAAALRGRVPRRMAEYGHGSGRTTEIVLRSAHPFVVDGDRFEPNGAGVRLSASPPLRFLSA